MSLIVLLLAVASQVTPLTDATRISCTKTECHLSVSARNGTECVDAYLSLSITVPYSCRNFSSECLATVTMPELNTHVNNVTTQISGYCGNGTASMLLSWSSERFQLRFDFRQKNFYSSQIMTSIASYNFVHRLTLTVDLRDSAFVNASIGPDTSPIAMFVSRDRTFLFASPLGLTFKCESTESVRLFELPTMDDSAELHREKTLSKQKTPFAVVSFPKVRLDVFRSTAPEGGLLEGPFLCESDSNKQARSTTILVISGLLAVCVFVIVCGFLATRLNKSSAYSSFE